MWLEDVALHNAGYDLRSACNHGIGLQLPSKTFVLHDLPWASSITMTLYLSEPEFLSVSCIMSAPDSPPFCDTKGSDSRCSNRSILNNTKKNDESSKLNSSNDSASWVEPKDAGQRRVQASGEPTGHWYTGLDGRKVYLNKSGKESTGRNAYRNYRKESGAASQKSKRKQLPRRESKL
ncbi:hypothetical protein KIW84_030728 [Lathyrus oleraceus]|uniref:Uncharacterized protein n=1 Tax=Pisum sativum TaxID=3888 RepID=A0A9D4XNW9_PEA|nr:hypothetical protein KIW84_030728 [Pisum sativum]